MMSHGIILDHSFPDYIRFHIRDMCLFYNCIIIDFRVVVTLHRHARSGDNQILTIIDFTLINIKRDNYMT